MSEPKSKRKKRGTCGLGQTVPAACPWKLETFKHGDKRPWGGKFTASKKATRKTARWYVLMGPAGQHRQFFQRCLAERVRSGLCREDRG